MPQIDFYNLRDKKFYKTDKYEFVSKRNPKTNKMVFMVKTKHPSGMWLYKIVGKDWWKKYKK